ncbi:hypothetical protein ASE48_11325 [Mycobacterium sp. Root265]|uniref:hypothetical protein n=1 Tax=Mycobacterium sp. Root265 TaxID=1736504 RepID=UPI00070D3A9F|nr:hypothetical protein [Mycobacterium sp. Root265]KRD07988.1 hypothetical protein ASE48_11325 [Mycobacterium sp. Root265]
MSAPGTPTAHPSRRLVVGLAVAAAAGATVLVMSASADAAPESDSQGYLESTARCTSPATAVIFGSTETSRIAICEQSDGSYQYRGVRVRDGARLVLPATATGDGYVAENDGLSYTVTTESLVVSAGDDVIRDESLLDVHKSEEFSEVTTSTQTTSTQTSTTRTSTTPLPPPLPAEVGAG